MQLVHTLIRFDAPLTSAFTACKFTLHRRRVTLCACEMLLPNCGPFPQISHTCAMTSLQILLVQIRFAAGLRPHSSVMQTTAQNTATRRGFKRHATPPACRIFSIPRNQLYSQNQLDTDRSASSRYAAIGVTAWLALRSQVAPGDFTPRPSRNRA